MNRCGKCGIRILDATEVCPLCHCVVETDEEPAAANGYPDIRFMGRRLELVGRILLFLSIAAGALSLILNLTLEHESLWSLVVIGALAYLLLLFFLLRNDHAGYRSKTLIAVAGALALVQLVDHLYGFSRWSLNYAAPVAVLMLDVLILVLMIVNQRSWQSYLLFQIFMILCSVVCVVLYLVHVITHPLLSLVALGISCTLFLGTFIIGGKRASNELKRRFHVM